MRIKRDSCLLNILVRKNKLNQLTLVVHKEKNLFLLQTENEYIIETGYRELTFYYELMTEQGIEHKSSLFKIIPESKEDNELLSKSQYFISSDRSEDIIVFINFDDMELSDYVLQESIS